MCGSGRADGGIKKSNIAEIARTGVDLVVAGSAVFDGQAARGLDEQGLEEYYRQRNLLKARVTGENVARAVMFFATRQTLTTGATIPVDGGLPNATAR